MGVDSVATVRIVQETCQASASAQRRRRDKAGACWSPSTGGYYEAASDAGCAGVLSCGVVRIVVVGTHGAHTRWRWHRTQTTAPRNQHGQHAQHAERPSHSRLVRLLGYLNESCWVVGCGSTTTLSPAQRPTTPPSARPLRQARIVPEHCCGA